MSNLNSSASQVKNSDFVQVTINNWSKFNPRADRANFTWFRMENDFFHDQALFGASAAHKLLMIALLCEASKKNSESVRIRLSYLCVFIPATAEEILEGLDLLQEIGLIEYLREEAKVTKTVVTPTISQPPATICQPDAATCQPKASLRTNERDERDERDETYRAKTETPHTDEILEQKKPLQEKFDMERVYAMYPDREGSQSKKEGIKRITRQIKTEERYRLFEVAVKNYAEFCDKNGKTGGQYVLQFATFVNGRWEEWIQPKAVAPVHNLHGLRPRQMDLASHNTAIVAQFMAQQQPDQEAQ